MIACPKSARLPFPNYDADCDKLYRYKHQPEFGERLIFSGNVRRRRPGAWALVLVERLAHTPILPRMKKPATGGGGTGRLSCGKIIFPQALPLGVQALLQPYSSDLGFTETFYVVIAIGLPVRFGQV